MVSKIKKALAIALLVSPLLSSPAHAQSDAAELNLDQKLQQILQLNNATQRRIRPVLGRLQSCLVTQRKRLEENFSITNLRQAQRTCKPLLDQMISKLGLKSDEEKKAASSSLYNALIKSSI